MDNGNDPPACIPCLKFMMKNMIPTNSGFHLVSDHIQILSSYLYYFMETVTQVF